MAAYEPKPHFTAEDHGTEAFSRPSTPVWPTLRFSLAGGPRPGLTNSAEEDLL